MEELKIIITSFFTADGTSDNEEVKSNKGFWCGGGCIKVRGYACGNDCEKIEW